MSMDGEIVFGIPEWDLGIDVPGIAPLLAPARRIVAILAALETEAPVAVIAAHADLPSSVALRHLQHLTRIGLAEAGKADADCFRAAPGPGSFRPAGLTPWGYAAALAWHLGCVFEAARVLGALALPAGEQIALDPARAPRAFADRRAALAWFTDRREDLERELECAYGLGLDVHAWRLALLMLNITCFTGPWERWRQVHERGMAAARRERHRGAMAMFEEAAGKLELTGGNPVAARESHQRALSLRSIDDDGLGAVRSLNALGVVFLREGSLPEARALFDWTVELARELGDGEFHAYGLMNLGAVHARTGPREKAVKELEEAITLLRASGRDPYVANALEDLAVAHHTAGDLLAAEQAALEAIEVAVAAGVPMFLPGPLIEYALIQIERGHLRIARALLREAHGIYTEIGDEVRAARAHSQIERIEPGRGAESEAGRCRDTGLGERIVGEGTD